MQYDRKDDLNAIVWAKQIKINAGFQCFICSARGVELHSHHINGWNWAVDQRYDIGNGVCLDAKCHNMFHSIYGHGNNTREQFNEFVITCSALLKIAEEEVTKKNIVKDIVNRNIVAEILERCAKDGYEKLVE